MRRYRVLVVDDSPTMRRLVSAVLRASPDLDVVGEACDAIEARAAIKALDPDVVTLDVEMPGMDGLDFLERLMTLRPMPVVMVSSLTERCGEIATRALAIGAVDCVAKPVPGDGEPFADLARKVRAAAAVRVRRPEAAERPEPAPAGYAPDGRVVAVGSSTGGVEALIAVLGVLPADCSPVVVTQHMPPLFTRSLADRLDRLCAPAVCEATDGAPLVPGRVYLAPGGARHLEVVRGSSARPGGPARCRLREGEPVNGHRPSVDALFRSVARHLGPAAVGVILTGMGRDGADGLRAMRDAGAATLGQDAATSLVYGMPRTAFEAGGVERQLPLHRIGAEIAAMTDATNRKTSRCRKPHS